MRRAFLSAILPALLYALLFPCPARAGLTICGCPSVYPVTFDLSLEYMKTGGSETTVQRMVTSLALKAVLEGKADIGMISRPLAEQEKAAGLRDLVLASEALTLFVSKDNPVEGLTRKEVGQIMRGEVRNWSDLSSPRGAGGPIAVIHHRPECGVRKASQIRFLGDENAPLVDGEAAANCPKVVAGVMDNPWALGYGPRSMVQGIPKIHVLAVDGVRPDPESILSGKYPYSFGLRLFFREKPSPNVSSFLDFAGSDRGRQVIAEAGCILPQE